MPRTAAVAALVLTGNFIIWLLLLRLPPVLAHPVSESVWLGFGETTLQVAGAWVLYASLAGRRTGVSAARLAYAAALPVIGLSHFVYIQGTTDLVPSWLPARMALAYIAGALQMVAGLGLLLRVRPRAAATLEALLISVFTVLVWMPRVVASPTVRVEWTAMLVSTALGGAAWIVARSFDPASGAALTGPRRDVAVVLEAWLVAGSLDIAAALTYYPLTAGAHVLRILQGIASGVLGPRAFDGGLRTAALGLALHYSIALAWALLFVLAVRRVRGLLKNLLLTGMAYGVVVWAVMNLVVLPLSRVRRGPFQPSQAVVAAVILILCIGLPIAGIIGRHERTRQIP